MKKEIKKLEQESKMLEQCMSKLTPLLEKLSAPLPAVHSQVERSQDLKEQKQRIEQIERDCTQLREQKETLDPFTFNDLDDQIRRISERTEQFQKEVQDQQSALSQSFSTLTQSAAKMTEELRQKSDELSSQEKSVQNLAKTFASALEKVESSLSTLKKDDPSSGPTSQLIEVEALAKETETHAKQVIQELEQEEPPPLSTAAYLQQANNSLDGILATVQPLDRLLAGELKEGSAKS